MRAGFRALLDAQEGIEVVGEADDGREVVELAKELRPDVILMDIRMPVVDGLAATRKIALEKSLDWVRIVILTTFELDEYVFDAIRAGAAGFLVKDTKPADLIDAVRVVAGATHCSRRRPRLLSEFAARAKEPPASTALEDLTEREREDAREPSDGQARRSRPCATRRARLRERAGPPRLARLTCA